MPEMTTTKLRWATDLGGRSAERGDEKAGDDRAVDSSLRVSRSDGKGMASGKATKPT